LSGTEPIGVFDSGVGGLSVLMEIKKILPAENIIYYADSAYCPYGLRSTGEIIDRCVKICDFLIARGSKLLVVACNSASIAGLEIYREKYSVPIVGMEPAIKPATAATRNGKVGVLATAVTISGNRFSTLLEKYNNGAQVFSQPCPGLVEQVEKGLADCPDTRALLVNYLTPLMDQGVDTIVLGCTHYPLVKKQIQAIAGPGIAVIDSGEAVARQVKKVLLANNLQNSSADGGCEIFYTSGSAGQVERIVNKLFSGGHKVINDMIE